MMGSLRFNRSYRAPNEALAMIRWTPNTPIPTPQRWQSRMEILRTYLDSLSASELLQVRPSYYALRFGWKAVKRDYLHKFDPDQPRVFAGQPGGGQWTGGGASANVRESPISAAARRVSPAVEAQCELQYQRDSIICRLAKSRSCWGQAALRYANCLNGLPIPPLNF
jgi:hypothetical protein